MALVAHRMMLPSRHRRSTTQQQVARNKVGVLLVPSVADYYAGGADQLATPQPTPTASQQHLNLQVESPLEPGDSNISSGNGKVSATSVACKCNSLDSDFVACKVALKFLVESPSSVCFLALTLLLSRFGSSAFLLQLAPSLWLGSGCCSWSWFCWDWDGRSRLGLLCIRHVAVKL
ncbi:uncharacterized protein LOC6505904 [Drosophila ananassae]|uniref:uncharacterized protein LOC6505904 n=1 Tax=Drosophila ananassae TaxID=7217 RepID=UPI0013A5D67A|nr:uncharacterized protein LOC6505904 [Drosophila ananassae]